MNLLFFFFLLKHSIYSDWTLGVGTYPSMSSQLIIAKLHHVGRYSTDCTGPNNIITAQELYSRALNSIFHKRRLLKHKSFIYALNKIRLPLCESTIKVIKYQEPLDKIVTEPASYQEGLHAPTGSQRGRGVNCSRAREEGFWLFV